MLGELQTRKLTRKFHVFDANGDGYVQRDDFDLIIANLLALRGVNADSEAGKAVSAQYEDYWHTLQKFADVNEDQQVDLAEWITYHAAALDFERVLSTEDEEGNLRPFAEVLFTMLDANDDGQISGDEYCEFLQAYNVDEGTARQTFEHLDPQGLGYLTLDQLFTLVDQFYGSNEPDAAGNWLFGPY